MVGEEAFILDDALGVEMVACLAVITLGVVVDPANGGGRCGCGLLVKMALIAPGV